MEKTLEFYYFVKQYYLPKYCSLFDNFNNYYYKIHITYHIIKDYIKQIIKILSIGTLFGLNKLLMMKYYVVFMKIILNWND